MTHHPLFATHKMNAAALEKVENVRACFGSTLAAIIEAMGNDAGRELALCKTHLEEASMYAVKAISMQSENQA